MTVASSDIREQIEDAFWEKDELNDIPRLQSYDIVTYDDFQESLEFLNKLLRPRVEGGIITHTPYCYMTIGNHIENQLCIFEGLSLNYDPLIWDLHENSPAFAKPMMVLVTLTGKYLHTMPSTSHNFYKGVNNAS